MYLATVRYGALVAVFVAFAMPMGAATISTDTVLGPDHLFPGQTIVVVDGDDPPTLVTVLDGARIGSLPDGGAVAIGFDAFGTSVVNMLGGQVRASEKSAILHDRSEFHMSAGETGLTEARDESKVNIEGGSWGAIFAYDSSRVRVNGPQDGNDYTLRTFGDSHAVVLGDEISLVAAESSSVVLRGGEFHRVDATGNSRIFVNGGMFSDSSPGAFDNSIVTIWSVDAIGGEPIVAADEGIVNVYGTGLRFDVEVDLDVTYDVIVGKLADGDDFRAVYEIHDQGQIILHEVPEPGTWALMLVGAAAMFAGRRAWGLLAGAAG